MKIFDIFKKPIKNEISELSKQIINVNLINDFETNSCGIKEGNKIISEYLTQNELGLAYEHLEYIITEVKLKLNTEQTKRMTIIAEKLGIKK